MTINAAHENAMRVYCDMCYDITLRNCVFRNGSDASFEGSSAIYVRWGNSLLFDNISIIGAPHFV